MESNGRCIWEYCNEKCECSECINCPHYRPNYKEEKDFLEELRLEQQEQM